MPMFRRGLIVIEARQLAGTAVETMDVIDWVRNVGEYYWLMGNANEPSTLIPEGGGKPGDPGVYLDPATGEFVIHNEDGDIRTSYGDWLIWDTGIMQFSKLSAADFHATYDPA